VSLGRDSHFGRASIDEDVVVPAGTVVGLARDADRRRSDVSEEGVVLVTRDTLGGPRGGARA